MPRKIPKGFDKHQRRWRKMVAGVNYIVSCDELGLEPHLHTAEGSYQAFQSWLRLREPGYVPHRPRQAKRARNVYFVFDGDDGIKIGVTADIKKRMRSIQTGCSKPITLLGMMPGNFEQEAELHSIFAKHRLSGEWFRDCPEIRQFIEANRTQPL